MSSWQGEVRHIGVKVFVAFGAMMDRIHEVHIVWTARSQIPQIVQHTSCPTIPVGTVPTGWAQLSSEVSTALDDLRFWQILDAGDAFSGIRQILTWSRHGKALRGSRFQVGNLAQLPVQVIIKTR
jgi:hypothetical protein